METIENSSSTSMNSSSRATKEEGVSTPDGYHHAGGEGSEFGGPPPAAPGGSPATTSSPPSYQKPYSSSGSSAPAEASPAAPMGLNSSSPIASSRRQPAPGMGQQQYRSRSSEYGSSIYGRLPPPYQATSSSGYPPPQTTAPELSSGSTAAAGGAEPRAPPVNAMEDQAYNPAKLFVGGLGQQSTEASLSAYFSRFGKVRDSVVIADRNSGRSRGFGFVVFESHDVVDQCLTCRHNIDGVSCEVRRAVPRDEARGALPYDSVEQPGKVYVGGLPENITEARVRDYFSRFGPIRNVTLMYDKLSHRPRGFGFIVFENYKDAQACWGQHPTLGRTVEAKKAEPRPELRRPAISGGGGSGGGGGGQGGSGRQASPTAQPRWTAPTKPQADPQLASDQYAPYPFPSMEHWGVPPDQQQQPEPMMPAPYQAATYHPREDTTDPYGYGALAAGGDVATQSTAPPASYYTEGAAPRHNVPPPYSHYPTESDPYAYYSSSQPAAGYGYETGRGVPSPRHGPYSQPPPNGRAPPGAYGAGGGSDVYQQGPPPRSSSRYGEPPSSMKYPTPSRAAGSSSYSRAAPY